MVSEIVLVAVILSAPLSILIPSLIKEWITPFPQGDAKWYAIFPVLYIYGVIVSGIIGGVLVTADLLVMKSGGAIPFLLICGFSIGAFIAWSFYEGRDTIKQLKEYKEAKDNVSKL